MRCSSCREFFDELEDWGTCYLCKACAEKIKKEFPEQIEKDISEIEIGPSRLGGGAQYVPDTGNTRLRNCREGDLLETINHEFVHFILHSLIGLRCCYLYDNIQGEIDSYHGCE